MAVLLAHSVPGWSSAVFFRTHNPSSFALTTAPKNLTMYGTLCVTMNSAPADDVVPPPVREKAIKGGGAGGGKGGDGGGGLGGA